MATQRASAPTLVRAGGGTGVKLSLRWSLPTGTDATTITAETRKTAWLVPGVWNQHQLLPEDISFTSQTHLSELDSSPSASDSLAALVLLRGLDPEVSYDVRLSARLPDGSRAVSDPTPCRTLPLAPALTDAPCVMCARHDRLLLQWAESKEQADEVIAYKVRYFDCEPRWPVKREVEAKLASLLLRPSEQTTRFLEGLLAMRVPPTVETALEGDPAAEDSVHFWLMGLAASRMYLVQVAAVTAGGIGEWSPKSIPLYTWRQAPALQEPRLLFRTHASLVFGLTCTAPETSSKGQDEEVEKFEVTLKRDGSTEAPKSFVAFGDVASELSAKLRHLFIDTEFPPYVVIVSGLKSSAMYSCSARAVTNAGMGDQSLSCKVETMQVPPDVVKLGKDAVNHCSARISWAVRDAAAKADEDEDAVPQASVSSGEVERGSPLGHGGVDAPKALISSFPDLMLAVLGEEQSQLELAERSLRGFRVRLAERQGGPWCEVPEKNSPGSEGAGVYTEAVPLEEEAEEAPPRFRLSLQGLSANRLYYAQVAAVTKSGDVGKWSDAIELKTEELAPWLPPPRALSCARQGALLFFPTPENIPEAEVTGYVLQLWKRREKSRAGLRPLEVPLLLRRPETFPPSPSSVTSNTAENEIACVWQDVDDCGTTWLQLRNLEPDTPYVLQLSARTLRGVGVASAEFCFSTRPRAPSMGVEGPRLLRAYHDSLSLACDGPVPDWDEGQESDVLGYRARFYECARYGPHGSWVQVDVEHKDLDYSFAPGLAPGIEFCLQGLLPEKQYVIQVAAVSAAGQGQWSPPSRRLSTWCVAPRMLPPKLLFRTHAAIVLGWGPEPPPADRGEKEVHDGEVLEFVVRLTPSSSRAEAKTIRVACSQALSLAEAWCQASLTQELHPDPPGAKGEQWPEQLLCEEPRSAASGGPHYVAVLHGLTPSQAYGCTIAAVSAAGEGHAAEGHAAVCTLAVAPIVRGAMVDEVQHDQIHLSWDRSRPKPLLQEQSLDRLDISGSVAELELRGYSVRCAAWTSWTRLSWQDPAYAEVESPHEEAGRAHFAVMELEAEKQYVVEVRAHSSRGAGVWTRIGDQPVCTAIVAQPPQVPEIVYATTRAVTFSFAGVENQGIIAYQVRRFEGWAGGWRRPTEPLQFDSQTLAVRVTSERRWIVTIGELKSDTAYVLQLRGVTQRGGVTKWSARSEVMCTQAARDEQLDESDIGLVATTVGSSSSSKPYTSPEMNSTESVEDFSQKLQSVLSFIIECATGGVRLPSVKIPSIAVQAKELEETHGSKEAALRVAVQLEDDATWRTKLPDFLIQQVPVVGCSTVLLKELWKNIRRCALIAQLYGHDTRDPEAQALILTCLVPTSSAKGSGSAAAPEVEEAVANSRKVVMLVSRALAKETFVRATGLKSAQHVVSLLESAGQLIAGSSAPPDSDKSDALPFSDDVENPGPAQVALVLFRPQHMEERPVVVLAYLCLWLLPICVSVARFVAAKLLPLLAQRIQMELPVAGVAGFLIAMQVAGILCVVWVQQNLENFVSIPATLVFVIYAVIPATSVYLATRSVLQGALEAPFFALLGVCNLASGFLRWADDISDDAALEKRPPPKVAACRDWVKRSRRALWVALLLDFLIEEMLGRVCCLHSMRLLGPAAADNNTTLIEYRTLAFAMGLLGAEAQSRLLELLQRRTVLLRLLGARKAVLGGLTLLLMGAFAVVQQSKTMTFLREVSPSPWWCCMILWIRQSGAIVGASVPVVLHVLLQPHLIGCLPVDTLVPFTLLIGVLLGHFFCLTFNALWVEREKDLESVYRVLHLFPHMSSKARKKAADAMRIALNRGAQATKNTAAEWFTGRVVRTGIDVVAKLMSKKVS